jgi:hypothetical protein
LRVMSTSSPASTERCNSDKCFLASATETSMATINVARKNSQCKNPGTHLSAMRVFHPVDPREGKPIRLPTTSGKTKQTQNKAHLQHSPGTRLGQSPCANPLSHLCDLRADKYRESRLVSGNGGSMVPATVGFTREPSHD